MEKTDKEQHISFVKDLFDKAESIVLANIEGLNASEIASLRRELHNANVSFKVVKNKLARLAIKGTSAEELHDDFTGSTAIAWSEDSPSTPAKILVRFETELEKLKLKSAFNSNQRLDTKGIVALSKLPGKDELRSQMLGLFNAVASKLLAQINAPAEHAIGVIQAKVDKDK